jgi:integrase
MRGSIRQRGKNSWRIQLYTGKGPDGKLKRHLETIRGRKGDAQRRLTDLLSSLDKGVYTPPGRLTVADLLNQWLNSVRMNLSPKTQDGYTMIVNRHLVPDLGHIQLKQLQPSMIESYYSHAREKPLSGRTVHKHHRLLKQALRYAIRQGYLGMNPCDLVGTPKWKAKQMRTLTPEEVEILLENAASSRYYPIIYTAVSTGLRQAELLGLRWRAINLDLKSISVCQVLQKRHGICEYKEPKTEHSKRCVGMTDKLVDYLSEYKGERESLSLHLGRLLKADDLVFSNAEGEPIDPYSLSHAFAKIAKRAGLRGVHFHSLRHSFASLMLLRGAKPKVISEALGHASVAFTLDTYSHIIEGMQSEAMALLDGVLPPGKRNVTDDTTPI